MQSIFSIDVEDWFHILDVAATPHLSEWGTLPSCVEKNFLRLLAILSEHKIKATCFFLGWIAQKYPGLVNEAMAEGHEIASHGYSHELVYKMNRNAFIDDAVMARKIIEDVVGKEVIGYRCSGFSVTEKTPWFFESLVEAGYQYDSSVFPARRGHGGMRTSLKEPYKIIMDNKTFFEFPITVTELFGKALCFFGGGYLRLFPYWIIKLMAQKVLAEQRPVIFYVHPREVDPDHPRLDMNFKRRFKSYVNLKSTVPKITSLFDDFEFTRFSDFLQTHDIKEVQSCQQTE